MPAVSKAQQKLMGMAYSLKKGEMNRSDASKEVQNLADSMTLDQLHDFAATKHKGLPNEVDESGLTGFFSAGPIARYSSYPQNIGASYTSTTRDKKDPLIQTFIDFVEGKEKKGKKTNENVAAVVPPGVAQTFNTIGMGNATPPSQGNIGSGDKFDGEDDEDEKIGILTIKDYKKWLEKRKRK